MRTVIPFLFFLFSVALGVAGTVIIMHYTDKKPAASEKITSCTISGAPLIVGETKTNGNITVIPVSYDGAGMSQVIITDDAIPSARAWNTYNKSVGFLLGTDRRVSILAGYRKGRFMGIADVWFKNSGGYSAGAEIGGMFLF